MSQTADNDKILAIAAPPLLEMLEREKRDIINKMIGEYDLGKVSDIILHVGNLALTMKMIRRIEAKLRTHEGAQA